ncbi:MAG: isopentenyl phosphate kinase family protein [Candidatus Micrarchaeota archaeon]|nr:isopentenyl phosphate kinase family protein [Candidatus Micrarchaeota archaeon]
MENKLYLVKIGGSVITDIKRPNTARRTEIRRLSTEIKKALASGKKVIIGHGGGSFPHTVAHKYMVHKGFVNGDSRMGASLTQHSAASLNSIVMEQLLEDGIQAVSFPPSAGAVAKDCRIVDWNMNPIKQALKDGFVPVTYGDVVLDRKQGVCIASTEEVFRYLAYKLRPYKIVIGTDVDGLFTADPKIDRQASMIREIGPRNIAYALNFASKSRKVDVTGGMKTKLVDVYKISKRTGAICQIVNARVPGRIEKALEDLRVLGTVINAHTPYTPSR